MRCNGAAPVSALPFPVSVVVPSPRGAASASVAARFSRVARRWQCGAAGAVSWAASPQRPGSSSSRTAAGDEDAAPGPGPGDMAQALVRQRAALRRFRPALREPGPGSTAPMAAGAMAAAPCSSPHCLQETWSVARGQHSARPGALGPPGSGRALLPARAAAWGNGCPA